MGVLDATLANELESSPIVNIQFVFDRKVMDLDMAACVDSPIEFVFDRSDAAGTQSGQCLVISLSAATSYMAKGSSELIPHFRAALDELFPAARNANVLSAVVTREATATFLAAPGVEAVRARIALQHACGVPRGLLVRYGLARHYGRRSPQWQRSRVECPEPFFRVD